ncbi:hypothetical protein chiPu_0013907 [Chiloscyllium punctatum]|uniref:Uncharacterized protein n=1 Tax=Chiloscyllium punctatum TaxID=137246 RepID=A0A401SYG6_CHIPU|nr:hypothetical protein [Chiloscyllium punctatum]
MGWLLGSGSHYRTTQAGKGSRCVWDALLFNRSREHAVVTFHPGTSSSPDQPHRRPQEGFLLISYRKSVCAACVRGGSRAWLGVGGVVGWVGAAGSLQQPESGQEDSCTANKTLRQLRSLLAQFGDPL